MVSIGVAALAIVACFVQNELVPASRLPAFLKAVLSAPAATGTGALEPAAKLGGGRENAAGTLLYPPGGGTG